MSALAPEHLTVPSALLGIRVACEFPGGIDRSHLFELIASKLKPMKASRAHKVLPLKTERFTASLADQTA